MDPETNNSKSAPQPICRREATNGGDLNTTGPTTHADAKVAAAVRLLSKLEWYRYENGYYAIYRNAGIGPFIEALKTLGVRMGSGSGTALCDGVRKKIVVGSDQVLKVRSAGVDLTDGRS